MSRRSRGLLLAVLLLGGCASSGIRRLTTQELEIMQRLHARLDSNRTHLDAALDDLKQLAAEAIVDRHSLSLSIAKAQLLESMKAPWVSPSPELSATQKEVVLYHLYQLHEAERDVLDARLRERETAIGDLRTAYRRLAALIERAMESQQALLAHLDRPADAQLHAVLTTLLAETRAFHETLATSENPRLAALARNVAEAEQKVARVRELLTRILESTIIVK